MSKLTSVVQAAQNALAAYLTQTINNPANTSIKPNWRTPLSVEPRWPDPKRLPERAITIVPAGPRTYGNDPVLGWWHYAQDVTAQYAGLQPGLRMWRWTVGWYEQPVQLDCWCLYDDDLDDLLARLDIALHTGPGELTAMQAQGYPAPDPIVDYLVLTLSQQDGWPGAFCGAYFSEDGPEKIFTAAASGQAMYRATWKGTLEVLLTVDAPSYQTAQLKFRMLMGEAQDTTTFPTATNYDLQVSISSPTIDATWSTTDVPI